MARRSILLLLLLMGLLTASCLDDGPVCPAGYVDQGDACVDVDECAAASATAICGPHAGCVNTMGSYRCVCLAPHWQARGITCVPADCETENGGCDAASTCSGAGADIVCSCPPGELNIAGRLQAHHLFDEQRRLRRHGHLFGQRSRNPVSMPRRLQR